MAYDVQPTVTIEEKKQLFHDAVDNSWILFFEHDPNITACTIRNDGKHYKKKNIINI